MSRTLQKRYRGLIDFQSAGDPSAADVSSFTTGAWVDVDLSGVIGHNAGPGLVLLHVSAVYTGDVGKGIKIQTKRFPDGSYNVSQVLNQVTAVTVYADVWAETEGNGLIRCYVDTDATVTLTVGGFIPFNS